MKRGITRRKFLQMTLTGAGLGLLGCSRLLREEKGEESLTSSREEKKARESYEKPEPEVEPGPKERDPVAEKEKFEEKEGIPRRILGKTGDKVSILGLGGAFTLSREDKKQEAEELVNHALDLGINYIDTAPTYGNSESNLGGVMAHRRKEAFLASKTLDRTGEGTRRLFERSLERLQTDYLDLYQLHGVHSRAEWEQALAPSGALRVLEELRREGVVKNIGITGHKEPQILLRAIEEYDFDCLLMSLNAGDRYYQPFQEELLRKAREKDMGIIAMKVAAYGRIFQGGGITSMEQALSYVLTFPVSTAVIGISNREELEENARAAREFEPYSPGEIEELEKLVEPYWKEANFFKKEW